jgi:hypothetical protein
MRLFWVSEAPSFSSRKKFKYRAGPWGKIVVAKSRGWH